MWVEVGKQQKHNLYAECGSREERMDWFLSHVTADLKKWGKKNYKIQCIHLRLEKEGNTIPLVPTTLSASLHNINIPLL